MLGHQHRELTGVGSESVKVASVASHYVELRVGRRSSCHLGADKQRLSHVGPADGFQGIGGHYRNTCM